MFFGKNLGRVGVDFRRTHLPPSDYMSSFMKLTVIPALLVPIFEQNIVRIFDESLSHSRAQFVIHLKKYRNLSAHKGLSEYGAKTGILLLLSCHLMSDCIDSYLSQM